MSSGRVPGPSDHLGDALSGLLDGELGPDKEDAALAHLTRCPGCAEELFAVRQARTWVRALPAVEPPFGFSERVLRQGGPRQAVHVAPAPAGARAQLRRRAGAVAVAAAAAAVTVLGVGTPRQAPVSPAVPRLVEAHASSASVGADLLSKLAPLGIPVSFGR